MQHALDEQRKDELRKESEALHQIKWHRINLSRPRPAAKVFVPVADSDADFEMLRTRVAALRLVQRRLQAEATVLTCELASVDGVGATARRTQLTNRSSLWHLADDLDRSLVAEQRATLDGALGEVEEEGEEAEAGDGRLTPRGQSLDDGGWERAAALMARLDAMASALEEQRQLTRQAEARVEAAEATGGVRAAEQKLRARVAEVTLSLSPSLSRTPTLSLSLSLSLTIALALALAQIPSLTRLWRSGTRRSSRWQASGRARRRRGGSSSRSSAPPARRCGPHPSPSPSP